MKNIGLVINSGVNHFEILNLLIQNKIEKNERGGFVSFWILSAAGYKMLLGRVALKFVIHPINED